MDINTRIVAGDDPIWQIKRLKSFDCIWILAKATANSHAIQVPKEDVILVAY
jgi:hypothetical protein